MTIPPSGTSRIRRWWCSVLRSAVGLHRRGCAPGAETLCLRDGRFRVEAAWRNFEGATGIVRPAAITTGESGLLWFFEPDNWEVLIKVLDGCAVNGRFWVFHAAATTVEMALTVTDTATGQVRDYGNPLGVLAPAVNDTDAFDSCL